MAVFPNVPIAPGVPAIPRDPFALPDVIDLLTADVVSLFAGAFGPQWGLFLDGAPVVVADNVVAVDYKQEWVIADYPLEEGAFETYDKVQTPFSFRLSFSAGGSEGDRQALLDSIDAIAGTTDLYDAVTPEAVYENVNVANYSYRRTATNGVGLITVDVMCVQIRIATSDTLDSTQSPSAAATVNDGTVQTVPATPTQQKAVTFVHPGDPDFPSGPT